MPTPVTREQIAAAVFNLADATAGTIVGLVTSARRFRLPTQVDTALMPALYQIQTGENYERTYSGTIGLPPKRTMHFEIAIYLADPQEPSVIPSQQMNAIMEAFEAAFEPDATTGAMTLGGIVASARIDGKIDYAENLAGDGKNLLFIPIVVIRP